MSLCVSNNPFARIENHLSAPRRLEERLPCDRRITVWRLDCNEDQMVLLLAHCILSGQVRVRTHYAYGFRIGLPRNRELPFDRGQHERAVGFLKW